MKCEIILEMCVMLSHGFFAQYQRSYELSPGLHDMRNIRNRRERANQTQPAQYSIFDGKAIVKQFMHYFVAPPKGH